MRSIAELLEYFGEDEDSTYCEFVPEDSIAVAEHFLKLSLPPSYKQFVSAAGTGDGRAGRLTGLGSEGYRDSRFAEDIELMKEWSNLAKEGKLIPFADDFSGNFYCFDYRKLNSDGECPVVFWDRLYKSDREPDLVADNFLSFMNKSIEDSDE